MNPEKQTAIIFGDIANPGVECVKSILESNQVNTQITETFDEISQYTTENKYDIIVLFMEKKDHAEAVKFLKSTIKETSFTIGIGPQISEIPAGIDQYILSDELKDNSLDLLFKSIFSFSAKIKAQSELAGLLIHDIRSPMQSILSYLELLQSEVFGALNEGQQKMLKNTLGLQDRILDMIEDLGEIMRFEQRSFKLYKTEFSIKALLQDVVKALWIQADKKNIKFAVSLTDETHTVFADRGALDRVLTNILTNAIRFSPVNGTVRVEYSCLSNNDGKPVCQFKITDSGPGIDKEDLNLIFDKYYRVLRFKSAKGLGLGLYAARLFVEEHQGTIGVYNNREGGATFHFQLPLFK